MRFVTKVSVVLVMVSALLQAPGDSGLGQTNCGFLTLEQCRATVSGIGGFCVPNQFYNPQRSAKGAHKQQGVRAYAMPYDPYPWCAQYSDPGR
jgi:hypothetical protein